jgi:Icc-related predicted phosphoesterase
MKLVIIADTHKEYHTLKLPKGDILIHAGDIDLYRYDNEFDHFNQWLKEQDFEEKIVVAGNHDGYLEDKGWKWITEHLNATYLENQPYYYKDIIFYGSPITPSFGNWSFMRNRGKEIKRYWNMIPNHVDVLITHGAPYGIMDSVTYPKEEHVGDFDLLNIIKEIKPKIHIFGHLHANYGIEEHYGIKFINASLTDEEYNLTKKPIIIDI